MVPETVSDAELILHSMICCREFVRRRLIVDRHTPPRTDELLEYVDIPHHKDISKPLYTCTQGLARIGAGPRHIRNHCLCLAGEAENNAQNAMELEYDSQKVSDTDSLTVETDLEPGHFSSSVELKFTYK